MYMHISIYAFCCIMNPWWGKWGYMQKYISTFLNFGMGYHNFFCAAALPGADGRGFCAHRAERLLAG